MLMIVMRAHLCRLLSIYILSPPSPDTFSVYAVPLLRTKVEQAEKWYFSSMDIVFACYP
jgi:hypothetical protein